MAARIAQEAWVIPVRVAKAPLIQLQAKGYEHLSAYSFLEYSTCKTRLPPNSTLYLLYDTLHWFCGMCQP